MAAELTGLDPGLDFEQGPIRPPSEARSLLLRLTRNCPWNRCRFCPVYKGETFSRRSLDEIKADIDTVARMRDQLRVLSRTRGFEGRLTDEVVQEILSDGRLSHSYRSVAVWLYFGEGTVFLQDANSLLLKPSLLAEALHYLKGRLPEAGRVTTYARSATAAKRTVGELTVLREAGLDRVHVGLESGYDPLLAFMDKGMNADHHVAGGRNIKAAGIELSEYVMPGLGGRKWSREHALATADVLNRIDPDFIRLRSLRVLCGVELHDCMDAGTFERLTDDETVAEIRLFVRSLKGIRSTVASDHIMNLIETVEGKLPEDRGRMLETLDSYLDLDGRGRLLYRLGRRLGRCREPADLGQPELKTMLEETLRRIEAEGDPDVLLDRMADGMI